MWNIFQKHKLLWSIRISFIVLVGWVLIEVATTPDLQTNAMLGSETPFGIESERSTKANKLALSQ